MISNSRGYQNKPGFHSHHQNNANLITTNSYQNNQYNGRRYSRGPGPSRNTNIPKRDPQDYKDLDEPKQASGKVFRTIVDYNDI